MKILFTGGSSFSGMWFVRELSAAGHEVTAVFRGTRESYVDSLRRQRVALAADVCRPIFGCSFGDERFLGLISEGNWDLLCHHGADVTNYKSFDFDATAALSNNTKNLPAVLSGLTASGCGRVVLTGSVFEGGEGAGSDGLKDVSPYGLSKSLTARLFEYYCSRAGVGMGKFVIPNPFGPLEEARFTSYVMKTWLGGGTAVCSSPDYVRDNIHVTLLAKAYAKFVAEVPAKGFIRLNPSGYVESQGTFTRRLAEEMRPRLDRPCAVELARQVDFPEPRVRINTDVLDVADLGWDESAAWDEMARYYEQMQASNTKS
jgi:nucleoside-diphosphate-sugar epimerase